jgi:capsular exopolysaccharide synthesis family protein
MSTENTDLEETSELKLYGQILWRRRWAFLATVTLVMATTVVYTLIRPKIYESSLLLLVSSKEQTPPVVSDDNDRLNYRLKEGGYPAGLDTEVEVLSTTPLLSRAVDALQPKYSELDAKSVADSLKIKQVGSSGIISVTYRDTNPERLLQVLSQLGATYIDFSLTNRKTPVTSTIDFIEKSLPEAQQNLTRQSQQLEIFRKQYNLVDPTGLGTSMTQALSNLDDQERTATAALRQSQALYQNLKQRSGLLPEQGLAAASLSQDPIYLDLLKQYQEAENNYRLEQIRFKEGNPKLQDLKAKRDRLNQLLQNRMRQVLGKNVSLVGNQRLSELQIAQVSQLLEAENNLKVQQAQLAAIQANRKALEKNFQTVPELQRQYDNLTRQVEVAAQSVERLLTRLEELRIVEARESAPWQVIQPPYSIDKPVYPNWALNLMIGSVLALMSGASVVYLREQLDNRLESVRSTREILPIPILGVVPQIDPLLLRHNTFPSDENLAVSSTGSALRSQSSYFREAFQSILFNLRFAGADEPMKTVGFTSSTCQEGKSTIVRYLGLSAAELGYRVLVVDGDLRQPELHLALEVPNEQGLSNILATGISWQQVVQNTTQPGLQVLTAGPTPPNPVALFDSIRMSQLMIQLHDRYDLVFVDLPPVVGLTDPLVVATHLDGLVLLVGLNRATRDHLKDSLESLSRARSRLIGAVCNMAKISETPNSAYLRENKGRELGNPGNQLVQRLVGSLLQGNSRK